MTEEKKGPGRPKKEEKVEEAVESPKASVELRVGMASLDGMWTIYGTKQKLTPEGETETYWIVEPTSQNTEFLGRTPLKAEDAMKLLEGK